MSSYLTIYLVPKKTASKYVYQAEKVEEIEITKGIPLVYDSYSRSSDVYQAFWGSLNPAYCGNEEKYTELTPARVEEVLSDKREYISKIEFRLKTLYEMLKTGGYSEELFSEILSTSEHLKEENECLDSIKSIANMVNVIYEGYGDFEKVLINVD